jgi:hypothetical protein
MVHDGAAMVTLMLLGALLPASYWPRLARQENRVTGVVMLAFNAVLIATAFGLYVRPWASDLHIAFGLAMPLLLFVHVKTGRKSVEMRHAPYLFCRKSSSGKSATFRDHARAFNAPRPA